MPDTIIEKREVPPWVAEHITRKGGLNQFGEPCFRVIWGGNRTYRVGGMFKEVTKFTDAEGRERTLVTEIPQMKTLHKYHTGRWWMERWRGPEFYGTREEWYQNTWDEDCKLHTMGDYPDRGDYEAVFFLGQCSHMKKGDTEWCMPCQVGMGEYIGLEENIKVLDMQIYALLKSEDVTKGNEMAALFMREHIKRNIRNKVVGERVRAAMRPSWAVEPHDYAGQQTRSTPTAAISKAPLLPRSKLGFSQSDHAMPATKQKELDKEN